MNTKLTITLGLISLLTAGTVLAQDPVTADSIPHWKRDDKRIVYYVPRPELKVTLSPLEEKKGSDFFLSMALDYSSESLESQGLILQKQYPGYLIWRVIYNNASDEVEMKIPSLKKSQMLELMQNQIGPYAGLSTSVTASEGRALKDALLRNPSTAILMEPKGTAWVPGFKVQEHVELSRDACNTIIREEMALSEILQSQSKHFLDLGIQTRFSETADTLKENLLLQCVELSQPVKISSFQQLMQVKVRPAQNPGKIIGEKRIEAPQAVATPAKPIVTLTTEN